MTAQTKIVRWVQPTDVLLLTLDDTIAVVAKPITGRVIILNGHGRTGPRGFWQLPLETVMPSDLADDHDISIVATPIEVGQPETAPRPVYLVAKVNGTTIAVWSFTAAGEWAPSVAFTWQCVRYTKVRAQHNA